MKSKTSIFNAYQPTRRKAFPAFRQDMALEIRIVKNQLRGHAKEHHDRRIVAGVLIGLKLAVRIWKRNSEMTQQALWNDQRDALDAHLTKP